MTIDKIGSIASYTVSGTNVVYTITITNNGSNDATGVGITDVYPEQFNLTGVLINGVPSTDFTNNTTFNAIVIPAIGNSYTLQVGQTMVVQLLGTLTTVGLSACSDIILNTGMVAATNGNNGVTQSDVYPISYTNPSSFT